MAAGRRFFITSGYSYARDRLGSHMGMPRGDGKTLEVLDDVIRVIDEYVTSVGVRNVGSEDFVSLTQFVSQMRPALDTIAKSHADERIMLPILAGLKKLVLLNDCDAAKWEIPNDPAAILAIQGPQEVDDVVAHLLGELEMKGRPGERARYLRWFRKKRSSNAER